MSVTLHRLGPDDAALLDDVAEGVFDHPVDPVFLDAYLNDPAHILVVARDGGRVVGQCAGVLHRHPDQPPELYVDEVGVAGSHLRRGIGRAMMDRLAEEGRAAGCKDAWLGTEPDNVAANALYRRHGPPETFLLYAWDL